jgi:hypothetical protein
MRGEGCGSQWTHVPAAEDRRDHGFYECKRLRGDLSHPYYSGRTSTVPCIEVRLAAYCPIWWTFPENWYAPTDPIRENGFVERCAAGITREYIYRTFVQADPALAVGIQRDLDRFNQYLAESSTPKGPIKSSLTYS